MNQPLTTYCLDANVLIQAWQKYYSPSLCPSYWEVLNELGKRKRLFLPHSVAEEILRTEDELSKWLRASSIPIYPIDGYVTQHLTELFAAHPLHKYLVDNIRGRSLADPWVVAHAMKESACVVTKEEKIINPNTTRIRIPNVCENMGVRWINDFALMAELGIRFFCAVG